MKNLLQQYQGHEIDEQTQARLNHPLPKKEDSGSEQEGFLKVLMAKLEAGELNTLEPRSLFNQAVYGQLSEMDQEKTDLTAVNIMSIIKQIETLWNQDHTLSFQLQNLVDTVFHMKSRFEEQYGDVFII